MKANERYFNSVKHKKDDGKQKETYMSKNKAEKAKKNKIKKKKKLIIRNLSFKVTNEELMKQFTAFGTVLNVDIPLKKDGKKKGFAFVEYADTKSMIQAMKNLNNKEILGRRVAIDVAIDKTSYQLKLQKIRQDKEALQVKKEEVISSESEDESGDEKPDIETLNKSTDIDENERRANEFLNNFESGFGTVQTDSDDSDDSENEEFNGSGDESEDDDDEEEEEEEISNNIKIESDSNKKTKRTSDDVSEGKTVFLRNVSFSSTKESLKEEMEKYGECEYCLICIDPFTEHSKGTAFVKYKDKESADKLIQESLSDSGVLIDGRRIMCSLAMKKEDIVQQMNKDKIPKDKRNLNLLRIGLIMPNSPESEGVSRSDMMKRAQLEMLKRQKLKNVNFFVSDTRLMVHNIPKTLNDAKLKKLFKKAAGKGSVITEARVMKEFKKTNAEGIPLSKGFGFVRFSKHEDALKALMALNNIPTIFTNQKRPIVEFSVENKVALLSKERRKEKIQQRNKKRTEEKQARLSKEMRKPQSQENKEGQVSKKKNRRKKKSKSIGEKSKSGERSKSIDERSKSIDERSKSSYDKSNLIESNLKTSKKQKRKQKSPKKEDKSTSQENFNIMKNKFKDKLINKMY